MKPNMIWSSNTPVHAAVNAALLLYERRQLQLQLLQPRHDLLLRVRQGLQRPAPLKPSRQALGTPVSRVSLALTIQGRINMGSAISSRHRGAVLESVGLGCL